jgi:dihydroorotase
MLLIKNGTVIDPANGRNGQLDVLIQAGEIAAVGAGLAAPEAELVDAAGKIVCPGFIDMHVHLREPGLEYKEDIASGTRAAAAGGFCSVCCMPNTLPVLDQAALISFVRRQAKLSGVVNVFPIGAVSKQQAGQELAEIGGMVAAGCVAISDDGHPVSDSRLMRNALEYAGMFGLPVLSHCEEKSLSAGGQMHEGIYSTLYGMHGIPAAAEEIMVARDIILAEATGMHVHICHVSSGGSVELIRRAKEQGVHVTCEVTPHHLLLIDADVKDFNTFYKVNPPLCSDQDRQALREGLADGTIDCIATDHAPHHRESKECEFDAASSGISGLETAVALLLDRLVAPGIISLETMIEKLSWAPAQVLGLARGTLSPGSAADITILDLQAVKTVDRHGFYSRGKNTPFDGLTLTGWPYMTIVGGRIAAEHGVVKE